MEFPLPLKCAPIKIHSNNPQGVILARPQTIYPSNITFDSQSIYIPNNNPAKNIETLETIYEKHNIDDRDLFIFAFDKDKKAYLHPIKIHRQQYAYQYELTPWNNRGDQRIINLLLEMDISNTLPASPQSTAWLICINTIELLHKYTVQHSTENMRKHNTLLNNITYENKEVQPDNSDLPVTVTPLNTQQTHAIRHLEQGINAQWLSVPGSGTTRTIINAIANCLLHNKSVIYVSTNRNRRHLVKEWFEHSKTYIHPPTESEVAAEQLQQQLRKQMEYTTTIFQDHPNLWYQFGQHIQHPPAPSKHKPIWRKPQSPTPKDIQHINNFIEELINKPATVDQHNIYQHIQQTEWNIQWQQSLTRAIEGLASSERLIQQHLQHIYTLWNIPSETPLQKSLAFMQQIQKTPDTNTQWYCGPSWHEIDNSIGNVYTDIHELANLKKELRITWKLPYQSIPVTDIIREHNNQPNWNKMLKGSNIIKNTEIYRTNNQRDEELILSDLRIIGRIQALERSIDRYPYANALGGLWDQELTHYKHIRDCLNWVRQMLKLWGNLTHKNTYTGPLSWDTNLEANRAWQISQWHSQQRQYREEIQRLIGVGYRSTLPDIETMTNWTKHPDIIRKQCEYNAIQQKANANDLMYLITEREDPYALRDQWSEESLGYLINSIPHTPFTGEPHIFDLQNTVQYEARAKLHDAWTQAQEHKQCIIASPYETYNQPDQQYDTIIFEYEDPNTSIYDVMPILARGRHTLIIHHASPAIKNNHKTGRNVPLQTALNAYKIHTICPNWIYHTYAANQQQAPYTLPTPNERHNTRIHGSTTGYTKDNSNWSEAIYILNMLKRFRRIHRIPTVYTTTIEQTEELRQMLPIEGLNNTIKTIGIDPIVPTEHIIVSAVHDDTHFTSTTEEQIAYVSRYATQQLDIIHSLSTQYIQQHPTIKKWEQGTQGYENRPPNLYTTTHWIANQLVERGWNIDTHIGSVGADISIAIKDPKQPKYYILGIICEEIHQPPYTAIDAYDYVSEKEKILQHHGWDIMYIPAISCYHQPSTVIQTIEEKIKNILQP